MISRATHAWVSSHLLTTQNISERFVLDLYEETKRIEISPPVLFNPKRPLALLFLEPSTRTRVSFEVAAHFWSWPTILVQADASSTKKGESLEDTILNIMAMGVRGFVVRSSEKAWYKNLSDRLLSKCSLINAGDGTGEHPTQALLDIYCMLDEFSSLKAKHIVIYGDIVHSRVARSLSRLCQTMGMQVSYCGPHAWIPDEFKSAAVSEEEALEVADVHYALRIQKERMTQEENQQMAKNQGWKGLQLKSIDHMKPEAIVMHPGPVNWGVELCEGFKGHTRSRILDQVSCGVKVRTVLLQKMYEGVLPDHGLGGVP